MALSLSSSHVRAGLRPSSTQRQLTKPLPPPRAGMGDAAKDIADAVVQNFSKPKTTVDSWEGTGSGFKGKISHHGRGKPFKDGFVNKKAASAEQATSEEQEQEGNDAASYVGEALERVVGHNFTGDETEPPANTGSAGWKGDIHDRKKDGFHARKV